MKKTTLFLIRLYQQLFSRGILKIIFGEGLCRYQPTCSEYTYQAVTKYGTIKGLFLGAKRVFHCHPFAKGGFDPVK